MGSILKDLSADEIQTAKEIFPDEVTTTESDSAVIRLANQIIIEAVRRGASDIHIEPNGREHATIVRFRVDGDCVDFQEIPSTYRNSLVARMKIMAGLDIAERRKPQDGKIKIPHARAGHRAAGGDHPHGQRQRGPGAAASWPPPGRCRSRRWA